MKENLIAFLLGGLVTSIPLYVTAFKYKRTTRFMKVDAESLNLRRTQFFSMIGHEIRTPLNGIIGFTDILRDSNISKEQTEYVDIIRQCSDSLLKVLNDLLDFTKIDSGRLEIDPHRFRAKDVADYIDTLFRPQCQKKNIQLQIELSKDVPAELYGDSHRLRQVLTNIVSNAIKFTDRGGICVRLRRSEKADGYYIWEVLDTGTGIKADNLPKIFSPFTQEHSGIARSHGGTGLGLSISKNLVELMGGQIQVQSTHGQGTRFYFTIPLSQLPEIS
jgi:signal transduction histidine kinase